MKWRDLAFLDALLKSHRYAVVIFSKPRLRELEFELSKRFCGGENLFGVLADCPRHFEQDAVNLGLLFIKQSNQVVVLLDRLQWLDEHGLPARTRAVHHALHAPLLFDFYRNDEALATYRDQLVLDRTAFSQAAQIAAQ